MTFLHALLVIAFCAVAGSYTWGMRGTILGGERGAMLPGAVIALILLQAGGAQPLSSLYPAAAVIGACGMFFGGAQTYGETIHKTYDAKASVRYFARLGLMVKGGAWFGIFAGILGFGIAAMAGQYPLWKVLLFVALLPCVKWLGVLLFNYPQKPEQNRFPKIYFSIKRFEVWGGMLLLCVYLIGFAVFTRAWMMLLLTVFGFVFGALGFLLGNLFQTALDATRENEKNLFAHMKKTGIFSGWKGMECIFGAVAAAGVGLCWCLFYKPFIIRYTNAIVMHNGAWSAFSEKAGNIILFAWLFVFMLFVLRYTVPQNDTKLSRIVYGGEDFFIFPVFCYVPLFLAACGCTLFSQVFSVSIMLYLLAEKIALSDNRQFETIGGGKVLRIVVIVAAAAALALQLFTSFAPGMYLTFAVYIGAYLLVFIYLKIAPLLFRAGDAAKQFRADVSWLVWAVLCAIVLLVPGWFYLH